MIVNVNKSNIEEAAYIHSSSWIDSHKAFCSPEFVAQHNLQNQIKYLQEEMNQGKDVFMLIKDKPVGIVSVYDDLIENLYVLPEEQHKGYGTELLLFALSRCRDNAALWILSNNVKAYNLYTKYGFLRTGKTNMLSETIYEEEMELKMMSKKGIIFDLDGTLWDASTKVVPAWNIVLKRHEELHKQITVADMQGFMGKTIETIGSIMFPEMESEKCLAILKECCDEEQIYLAEHGGILYPHLEEILQSLSKKYSLYIVSNCQDGYVQAFLKYHKLGSYFKDIEMSGRTGKSKGENIKLIMERNKLDKAVYVGDTIGDFKGAEYAEIPFIYAAYGFGQVVEAEHSISSIAEINEAADKIFK